MKTERFKEATKELHRQVEEENLARYIMDHTIDLETYRLLLFQNYLAYKTTERAIAVYIDGYKGNKHQQLEKDLKHFEVPEISLDTDFTCRSLAEAFGAAYVVEGSALGGMVIAKNINKCAGLSSVETHYFFNGNRDNLRVWNDFKKQLSHQDFSEKEEQQATEKAKDTFRFFRKVFQMRIQK